MAPWGLLIGQVLVRGSDSTWATVLHYTLMKCSAKQCTALLCTPLHRTMWHCTTRSFAIAAGHCRWSRGAVTGKRVRLMGFKVAKKYPPVPSRLRFTGVTREQFWVIKGQEWVNRAVQCSQQCSASVKVRHRGVLGGRCVDRGSTV